MSEEKEIILVGTTKRICITEEDLQDILTSFGFQPQLKEYHVITDWQEVRKEKRSVRMVIKAVLTDGRAFAVRLMNERDFILDISHLCHTPQIIEKQSEFAALLRKQGMNTPKQFTCMGQFGMQYQKENYPLTVTLEEWLDTESEKRISGFLGNLFGPLGATIGTIHHISEKSGLEIGFSIVYKEVQQNRMEFLKLFMGCEIPEEYKELVKQIGNLHDARAAKVASMWSQLPRGAVQGDIYSCNNIVWMMDEDPAIFDFNIAADEVYLGDLLHTWYRTVYDSSNRTEMPFWDMDQCWNAYLLGYESARKLTDLEKEWLIPTAELFETIYASKLAAQYLRQGNTNEAEAYLKKALDAIGP